MVAEEDRPKDANLDEVKELFRAAVIREVERRIQKALEGEEQWELLQQYVDSRIQAFLGKRGEQVE